MSGVRRLERADLESSCEQKLLYFVGRCRRSGGSERSALLEAAAQMLHLVLENLWALER